MKHNSRNIFKLSILMTGLMGLPDLVVASPTWEGWYAGVTAGYSEGNTNLRTRTEEGSYFLPTSVPEVNKTGRGTVSAYGSSLGINIGLNQQENSIVYGLEVSLAGVGIDTQRAKSAAYPCCAPAGFQTERTLSLDWLGTLKGRAGYLVDDSTLMYGLAGLAFTDLKVGQRWQDDFGASAKSSSRSFKTGYLLGAGIERKLGDDFSIKAEYSYINFEPKRTTTTMVGETDPFTTKSDLRLHSLNIGIAKYF